MAESLDKKRNVNPHHHHPPVEVSPHNWRGIPNDRLSDTESSSYSELRMNSVPWSNYAQSATEYQRYVCPSSYSQTSSVPESLYEPLQPRADSQLSMLSHKSPGNSLQRRNFGSKKAEAEIDELTNLLMNSLRNNEVFFGICKNCGEKIVGDGQGTVDTLGQIFHVRCFVCRVCECSLQGKSFFYVDNKPYCEKCQYARLEKCCVCNEAVIDRILKANGKPYHVACFKCVVCQKSLEGIQFTIDHSNNIYCIEDFHRKFAPRCSVCQKPIMPEKGLEETHRVVALDRSFHVHCYKCEDCHLVLSNDEGRGCYPLDGNILCKGCNAKRVRNMKI